MDVLSPEPDGDTNSRDLMNLAKIERNPPRAVNAFDG
jgi:hypothetical protein